MPNWVGPSSHCCLTVALIVWANPGVAGWVALEKQYQPAGLETIYDVDPEQIQRTGNR